MEDLDLETFLNLVGDKILELKRCSCRKDYSNLAVSIFYLKEINEETLKPILQILKKYKDYCRYTQRVLNYLNQFFIIEFNQNKISIQRI